MKRRLFLLMIILFLIGCQNQVYDIQDESLFHLDEAYYNNNSFILIDGDELKYLEDNNNSFIAFVFMPLCHASAIFYEVVAEFINTHDISMYRIPFPYIENTRMADAITYFPTAVIYRDGLVRTFLQSDKNEHILYYQSAAGFESWLIQYIYLIKE